MSDYFYSAHDVTVNQPFNESFPFHNHSEYEIYLFLEGDTKYIVEEKNYPLSPDDIIIIRKHEMHRAVHNSNKKYRRIVVMVSPEFFKEMNCCEYEDAFLNPTEKIGNKINSTVVHSSGLYNTIMRLKDFTDNFSNMNTPIANSLIVEILYLINRISKFEFVETTNSTLKSVISYINNHYTEEITLNLLCKKFIISKYHLCHIFKDTTGLSIQQYIKQKRLTLAEELKKEGKPLTEVALSSGFRNYSSFYRAHAKNFGTNPKGTTINSR